MSGGLMSGGRMSGGRLSGGLKSYDPILYITLKSRPSEQLKTKHSLPIACSKQTQTYTVTAKQ